MLIRFLVLLVLGQGGEAVSPMKTDAPAVR